jgi:hypothetical protein
MYGHSPQSGDYCGPLPQTGNGRGVDGRCTGADAAPPCAPGAVVGEEDAYTLPSRCDGQVFSDGRLWVAELSPPTNGSDLYVWMRLDPSGELRSMSFNGTAGFRPDTGGAPTSCPGRTPGQTSGAGNPLGAIARTLLK